MKKLFLLTLILLSSSLIVGIANATETFTVPGRETITRSVGLSKGDKVSGSLSVIGGEGDHFINFYVTDPNENTIVRYNSVTKTSFSFTAQIFLMQIFDTVYTKVSQHLEEFD